MNRTLLHRPRSSAGAATSVAAPRPPDDGALRGHDDHFELWFGSLFSHKAMAFRCDRSGHVDLDGLGHQARINYLAARALIGREYAYPVVRPVLH